MEEKIVFNEENKEFEIVKTENKKKEFNYYVFIEKSLYIITSILFILFYNGIVNYKIFLWFLVLSFLFSLFSNEFIMKIFNNKTEINNKKDKIKK